MSMSRIPNKHRNRTAPRPLSPNHDPKLLLIKQRINQIASNMRSPLKPSNQSLTPESHLKETRIRTPPRKEASDTLEDFLSLNGFDSYIQLFQDNQITIQDLPYITKEDLIDMKIPIGPRNRLITCINNWNTKDIPPQYEASPKRLGLKDEVDKFMNELSQFSKRSEPRVRPSSRDQSLEASFDSEVSSQRICSNILGMLKDISDKQGFMMRAIEENQKAIASLRLQYASSKRHRCSCSECR
jgi:SAM domain (Sterile alpha motif)